MFGQYGKKSLALVFGILCSCGAMSYADEVHILPIHSTSEGEDEVHILPVPYPIEDVNTPAS